MKSRKATLLLAVVFTLFMVHRMTRPISFFEVSESFERPQAVAIPEGLDSISANGCALCHERIAHEWETSIHANAWKDPYFQADFRFDGSLQICRNCHTPLENQQEYLVTGFRDSARLDPVLKLNPNYDKALQNEGVTCAVCHIKDGVIVGPYDIETDAHPVRKDDDFTDGSSVCKRCHMVKGDRWDVFLKLPPCGNFAEIEEAGVKINCVKCHMPTIKRSMAAGAPARIGGRHLWRGGHDPEMVKSALKIKLVKDSATIESRRIYRIDLTNTGTEHRLPTGTPDRHLEIIFRLFDKQNNLVKKEVNFLERVILWRPFIIDLWDTRIRYNETRSIRFEFSMDQKPVPALLDVEVKYGLLHEKRRRKMGYENKAPIWYTLFSEKREP